MTENTKNKYQEKSKQRILKAATRLFAQKDYDSVGIREICKKANANICMISYFWDGKEGLYQGIIDDLIQRQGEYARTFVDLHEDLASLSKTVLLERINLVIEKAIEMLYGGLFSKDLICFLIRAQIHNKIKLTSPLLEYFRKLIAFLLNKEVNDKEVIFKTLFIISQINAPLVLPALSLKLLNQEEYTPEDKDIIRENIKMYVKTLFGDLSEL